MRASYRTLLNAIAASGCIVTLAGNAYAGGNFNFWIDESMTFSDPNGGCGGEDVEDVTSELAGALRSFGHSGTRWADRDAWTVDFVEACDSSYGKDGNAGIDDQAADSATIAVFAGHGGNASIGFGYKSTADMCSVDLGTNSSKPRARLGGMAGANAGYAIYLTCCTLQRESILGGGGANHQWLRQQFGFHDHTQLGESQAKDFYNATQTQSNKDAWFSEMEDRPSWFTGDNSPAVLSHSVASVDDCWSEMNNDSFEWGSRFYTPLSQTPSCGDEKTPYWCYYYKNNNNEGC